MQHIYLDYAAATPLDPGVLQVMQPYFTEKFYNPSATYAPAKAVRADVADARSRIARHLGAKANEVIFAAGGTEANNLAIKGIMQQFPDKQCLFSAVEHESIRQPAQQYSSQEIAVDDQGCLDLQSLSAQIHDETVLISCAYADSELGVIQPLAEIAAVVRQVRHDRRSRHIETPLYLHSDASQAANYLDMHVDTLGVDLLTLNGGKMYGPKQSGAVYVRRPIRLSPVIHGGRQEKNSRSGTENVAFAVGLAEAFRMAQNNRLDEVRRLRELQALFIGQLESLPGEIQLNGSRHDRLVNNVHVTIQGRHNERLLLELEQRGILAAAGSACSARNATEPSATLRALGRTPEQAQQSVRFTLGRATSREDITQVIAALSDLLYPKQ